MILKKKKVIGIVLSCIVSMGLLVGCDEMETVSIDNTLPKLDNLKGNSLSLSHDIEQFKFKTNYSVDNYNFENWMITDSKNVKMTGIIENLPEGAEVLVEHVHVDISLKSTSPQLNGLTQDSMDDSYHGYSQDGFFINNNYAYENVFAIEGFSKDIIDGWAFYTGDYGQGSISSKRLTEWNLISSGTYGNKLQVVYDLLIKYKGENQYHTKSVIDEFIIPVPQSHIDQVFSKDE